MLNVGGAQRGVNASVTIAAVAAQPASGNKISRAMSAPTDVIANPATAAPNAMPTAEADTSTVNAEVRECADVTSATRAFD